MTLRGYTRPRPQRRPPPMVAPAPAVADDVIRQHLPLVRRVVQRLAPRRPAQVSVDDLVSWGIEGLLDALQKYDPAKQAAFTTYAQFRIRGAILDRVRGQDWVSRGTRQKAALLERTYRMLEHKLGRPAAEEEVAAALGMSLDALHTMLTELGRTTLFSLDDLGLGPNQERFHPEVLLASDGADPFHAVIARERVDLVAQAIARLPDKERMVVALYYHEGVTMKEAGEALGVTESRVSQLHSQALLRLRGLLREHFGAGREGGER
jgi:RNA polymerase sigma factor FliA